MGIIINTNIGAVNASRQLGITRGKKDKSVEKLSSGYKINRSADGAAELTISEKMRAQIRGLNQASDNITEGISLVQVAEGAMGEVTDIIQRMRELTVKAYNGTMTQDDRLTCQAEVDSLLEELNRIGESTEFNTIKVLQGDPSYDRLVKAGEVTETYIPIISNKELPAWIIADEKMHLNNAKVDSSNQQDVSRDVIYNQNMPNEELHGPGGIPWSDTMTDNYSAVVDFSALAAATPKERIAEMLRELVSTGIGFPCSTCSTRKQGFYFATSDMKNAQVMLNNDRDEYNKVNIDELLIKIENSTAADPADIKALAEEVTDGLINSILDKTKGYDHFDIIQELKQNNGAKTYSIVAYDLRDSNTLGGTVEHNLDKEVTIVTEARKMMTSADIYETLNAPIYVQAGSTGEKFDRIPVHLPDITTWALGLDKYSVFQDGYSSLTPDKKLEEGYHELYRYDAEKGKYVARYGENSKKEETITRTWTESVGDWVTKIIKGRPAGTDKYGEPIPAVPDRPMTYFVQTGTVEKTGSFTRITYDSGKDEPALVYEPSHISLLDKALDRIMDTRSGLGARQNRLEYARRIDNNSAENTQAAESKIRDTDVAKEMVSYAKENILEQVSQAMLSHANQSGEMALSLLQ